jgi:hypothetical protein
MPSYFQQEVKNTDHFTAWLYFHYEQLSQTHYDKLSKSRQQVKVKTRRKNEKEQTTAPLRDSCRG